MHGKPTFRLQGGSVPFLILYAKTCLATVSSEAGSVFPSIDMIVK